MNDRDDNNSNLPSTSAASVDYSLIVEYDLDGVTVFDSKWRYVFVNPAAERLYRFPKEELLGRPITELYPGAFNSPTFDPLKQAMQLRQPCYTRIPSNSSPGKWREARAIPVDNFAGSGPGGLLIYWRDITELHNLETARENSEARARAAMVALDAIREGFLTLDCDFKVVYANAEACSINGKEAAEFVGKTPWDEWPTSADSIVEVVYRRVMSNRTSELFVRNWRDRNGNELWLEINVYPDEVSGGIHVVLRDITARHNSEMRESFLTGLSERTRILTDQKQIIAETVLAVGQFLNVQRCVFADVDLVAGTSTIEVDYCEPGTSSIAGVYPLTDYGEYFISEFSAGNAVAVSDVRNDRLRVPPETVNAYVSFGLLAHLTVPLVHNARLVSAIAVHSSAPREWSSEEIELLQRVVERTWFTVEIARQHKALVEMQRHDRNIAEQLQRALFPEMPEDMTGFVCQSYYRAALKEADVGGDFVDCFSCADNSLNCIAVGDVSGKGLKAARQVSAVRNMLRFAMHANKNISLALDQLNYVLGEQEKIDGFTTLFSATFNPVTNTLSYVNCGQEPGILWRAATNTLEFMPSTAPVIGVLIDHDFASVDIEIMPGDVLALFTDGLTEAGVSRRELLNAEGVADLFFRAMQEVGLAPALSRIEASERAESVIKSIIAGVEYFAGGPEGLRDDIAMMIGIFYEDDH